MKKSIVVTMHLIFWVIYILYILVYYLILKIDYAYKFPKEVSFLYIFLFLIRPVFFYLAYVFIFKIIKNKKVLLVLLITFILSYAITFVLDRGIFAQSYLLLILSTNWFVVGGLFRFFVDWINKDRLQIQLSQQSIKSELALLRNQINPHFLFNSIHNIDTLISTNPAKASDSLLKLSDMLRYSINDADTDFIDLSKEIDYIRKYLSLQELRLTNKELVDFSITGNPENIRIAPMLFIPFIENAFKHITDKEAIAGISIKFNISDGNIHFEIINNFDQQKVISKDSSSGIGLTNVSRRLDLIYPDKHKLKITKEGNLYKAELTINTNAN